MILGYDINDEWFEYEVDYQDVDKRLRKYLINNRTKEELVDYLISCDGSVLDIYVDYEDEIHEIFYNDAEKHYYDCKNSDNGVDQEDFV